MKSLPFLLLFSMLGSVLAGQGLDLETYYERSGYTSTPRYEETVAYARLLDRISPWITYTTFGISPQGRDLPLLIIDRDGIDDPGKAREAGRTVVLIQACIHAGECDGKDAGLMFFRDLILSGDGEKIGPVTYLFIPIFNVDGHERFGPFNRINQDGPEEMGWRTTAQNLNLNRDYVKAVTPEMQAWLKLYNKWAPDLFIDIHVTDGADYQYVSTYGIEDMGNMDQSLTRWLDLTLMPALEGAMEGKDEPIFPYVMFRRWHDPRSGLRAGAALPRYSQGYTAVRNRIGILLENHSLKDYKTRVGATYDFLGALAEFLENNCAELKTLNRKADSIASSPGFRQDSLALTFKTGSDSVMTTFKGVAYDVDSSELTGGPWFRYHPNLPVTYEIPYFNHIVSDKKARLPEAYIIPAEWTEITERLDCHGIRYYRLEEETTLEVQSYHFTNPEWDNKPFEGRFPVKVSYDVIEEECTFPAGSVVVPMDQPSSRLIAHMMEPDSPDSFLRWGFFNAIFEMKEYFETYEMEQKARDMIRKDPSLLEEFHQFQKDNPRLVDNQWAQLEWFYRRSPYWDSRKDVYPIGKIYDLGIVDRIKQKEN